MKASTTGLVADLISGDERRADAAVERLEQLSAADAQEWVDFLAQATPETDEDARWWITRALAELPSEVDTTWLLTASLSDSSPAVRQCAALGLRRRRSPQAVPALIAGLADSDALVSRLCSDALAALGAESVPALLETFQNGPPPARIAAARALAAIGDQRSIPALIAALDDGSALIEHWANAGLERMGVGMAFFNPE